MKRSTVEIWVGVFVLAGVAALVMLATRVNSAQDNLPKDTSAAILTAGLLGAQFVGLEAGGDDRFLKDGDEIKLTQSAIQLEQLIGQMIFGAASGENKDD